MVVVVEVTVVSFKAIGCVQIQESARRRCLVGRRRRRLCVPTTATANEETTLVLERLGVLRTNTRDLRVCLCV